MATKSSIAKQKRRAGLVKAAFAKRQALKEVILNSSTSDEERLEAVNKLNALPRNTSKVRLRNRCQFTGRARGVLRKFMLSRLCFREMASAGLIPGVFKASW